MSEQLELDFSPEQLELSFSYVVHPKEPKPSTACSEVIISGKHRAIRVVRSDDDYCPREDIGYRH